jgi:hypothetical protein
MRWDGVAVVINSCFIMVSHATSSYLTPGTGTVRGIEIPFFCMIRAADPSA